MNNPLLIPVLLKDTSINNGFIYNELKKTLPCRIGIEFEAGKSFIKGFNEEHKVKATNKYLTDYYHVKEIKCDKNDPEDDSIVENRISIRNYKELKGLYRFMQDLSKYCTLHEGGGIHIHVDVSTFFKNETDKMKEVAKYIERHLNEVASIFPKYTGKFNKRRVGIRRKSTYLNISRLNTFEFRIAPLTFDYFTLMTWIRNCIKFRNKVICECSLKALDEKKICEEYKTIDIPQASYGTPNQFRIVRNRATSDTRLDGTYDTDSDYIITNGTVTNENVVNYNLI